MDPNNYYYPSFPSFSDSQSTFANREEAREATASVGSNLSVNLANITSERLRSRRRSKTHLRMPRRRSPSQLIDFETFLVPLSERGYEMFGDNAGALITVWDFPGWRGHSIGGPFDFLRELTPTSNTIGRNWLAAYPTRIMEGMADALNVVSTAAPGLFELINRPNLDYDHLVVMVIVSLPMVFMPFVCL